MLFILLTKYNKFSWKNLLKTNKKFEMRFIMLNSSLTTMCEPDSPTFRCNTPTSLKLNQFEFAITYPNKSEMITLNGIK